VRKLVWPVGLCLIAAVAVCGCSTTHALERSAGQSGPPQSKPFGISIYLRENRGAGELYTSALYESYAVNTERFSFTAAQYDRPGGLEYAIPATFGRPVPVQPVGQPAYQPQRDYEIPVAFSRVPGLPGMYDVQLHVADDFGKTGDGRTLVWWQPSASWPVHMWWPDERRGDPNLAALRRRFVGKDVYGYGGVVISCWPQWFKVYSSTTPIRVKAVVRDQGRLEELWTGTMLHWGDEAALHFMANDPVRFVVDSPKVKDVGEGGSGVAAISAPCPAIVLADWQVDLTISTAPPPTLPGDLFASQRIWIGMSRDEVAWRRGYPNEFSEKRALDRETTWRYKDALRDSYSVTFRGDKVASYTSPARPP